MAKFGAKYPCFAPFATEPENGMPTYQSGVPIGKLVSANLTVNLASGEQYADDMLDEQLSEFSSGSLPMETNDMTDDVAAIVYGAKLENGEVRYNTGDTPPYGGLGYYQVLMRKGIRYYRAVFYTKVRAALGNDNAQTRGNSITFSTTSTTFTIFAPETGDWRITKTFDDEATAKAWIQNKLNVTGWNEISIASSGHGNVTPIGTIFVANAGTIELTFNAVPTVLYDNGVDKLSAISSKKYKVLNITENHNIVVAFANAI